MEDVKAERGTRRREASELLLVGRQEVVHIQILSHVLIPLRYDDVIHFTDAIRFADGRYEIINLPERGKTADGVQVVRPNTAGYMPEWSLTGRRLECCAMSRISLRFCKFPFYERDEQVRC